MQVFWVSGPTARVVSYSITARTVSVALAGICLFMLLLGFVFHFVGLRVAVEYSPELVHSIGGVTSQSEQERMEARYRAELEKLNQQLVSMFNHVKALEDRKNEFTQLLGSGTSSLKAPKNFAQQGRGGPMKLLPFIHLSGQRLADQLDDAALAIESFEQSMGQMDQQWHADLLRVAKLPISLPLNGSFHVTSHYGLRADPITGFPSMHEGIDFVAPVGQPVLATAPGVVVRSEVAGAYGQMIDVQHAEGYTTRYAHLSQRHVNVGEQVQRGQKLGALGNTGRSTGPHLHYEILKNGRALNTRKAWPVLDRAG